jgi:phenylacetate-CoA ligase
MHRWIERGYSHLPVWAQNAAVTAFGISYRNHRLGGDFEKQVAAFRIRDHWSPQQMDQYVEDRIRDLIVNAFEQVPYYHKKWHAIGLDSRQLKCFRLMDLPKLPITPKDDLRAYPDLFLSQNRSKKERLSKNGSSGSTGTPINVIWTSAVRRKFIAAREVRSFGWAGTSVRLPRAMIGGRPVVQNPDSKGPYYRYNYIERQVYFSAYHLNPQHAAAYVEGLNKYKPAVFTGYAHCYYFLARHMLEQGLRLDYNPDALILSSEPVTAEMKSVMRGAFGAPVFEEYAAVENCFLVTECQYGSLHVNLDFGLIEILDEHGKSAAPGTPGSVVATGLLNNVQPLIRYRIGDVATLAKGECICGRTQFPVLEAVEGRLEDVVVGPDGREMVRFHSLFINLPRIIEGQVIQEAIDRLHIKVVATDGFGIEEERTIRQRAVQRLGRVQVQVERVSEIPRNARGKFRSVVSLLSTADKKLVRTLRS